ncbi:MAG TPA: C2 family cysteine protease [Verrucomicrobiae bacterium]
MYKTLVLILLATGLSVCHAAPKHKPQLNQDQENASFRQLFSSLFLEWDSNHDGVLDLKELNAVIEDPNVRGSDAAVAVVLHRRLQIDDEAQTNILTLQETLSLAENPQIQKNISGKAWHIIAIDHALFAPGDPNLQTFHQGGIGDCYLLAVIGAFVFQHPEAVRQMIHEQNDGTYQIQFGSGRQVIVDPATDSELIMGASEGHNHGVWLSILEKAYAQIALQAKEKKTGEDIQPGDDVPTDFIGHGGYYAPVIVLLSGHKASGVSFARWLRQDPQNGLERANEMLSKLSSEHKLMATNIGGTKTLPKGLIHGHVYGVLGYNTVTRQVTMFNPWGNHFKPAGPPGLAYGYPTDHGIFAMPLDEFVQVYGGLTYETDTPVIASR